MMERRYIEYKIVKIDRFGPYIFYRSNSFVDSVCQSVCLSICLPECMRMHHE